MGSASAFCPVQNTDAILVHEEEDQNKYLDKFENYQNIMCGSDQAKKKAQSAAVSNGGLRKSPNKWSNEENQRLAMLVNKYGEKKWKRISLEMGGQKTGAQCAQHWKRVSSPEIRKGPWAEDEEALLFRMVAAHGSGWKKIAKRIARRTDIQCRYQYLKAKQSREVKWAAREDEALIKKVAEMGERLNWLDIAEHMAKLKHTTTLRTALECKERYLALSGIETMSCTSPREEFSPVVKDEPSTEEMECCDAVQEYFPPPPAIIRPARVEKDNKHKDVCATEFQAQRPVESSNTGAIFLERHPAYGCRACCSPNSCSECRKQQAAQQPTIQTISTQQQSISPPQAQQKQQPLQYMQKPPGWDCLESLAAVASVLPRELAF